MDLKAKRKRLGVTQHQLAKVVKCKPQQIWAYENNKLEVPIKYVPKICRALKIPMEDLINFIFEKKKEKLLKGLKGRIK